MHILLRDEDIGDGGQILIQVQPPSPPTFCRWSVVPESSPVDGPRQANRFNELHWSVCILRGGTKCNKLKFNYNSKRIVGGRGRGGKFGALFIKWGVKLDQPGWDQGKRVEHKIDCWCRTSSCEPSTLIEWIKSRERGYRDRETFKVGFPFPWRIRKLTGRTHTRARWLLFIGGGLTLRCHSQQSGWISFTRELNWVE